MCSIMEIYNVLSLDRHFDLPPEISWNTDIGPRKCFTTVFRSNFSTVAKASESIRRIGAIWRCQEIGSRNPLPMVGEAEQEYKDRNTRKIKNLIGIWRNKNRTQGPAMNSYDPSLSNRLFRALHCWAVLACICKLPGNESQRTHPQ